MSETTKCECGHPGCVAVLTDAPIEVLSQCYLRALDRERAKSLLLEGKLAEAEAQFRIAQRQAEMASEIVKEEQAGRLKAEAALAGAREELAAASDGGGVCVSCDAKCAVLCRFCTKDTIAAAVLAEREECGAIAREYGPRSRDAVEIADRIRARGAVPAQEQQGAAAHGLKSCACSNRAHGGAECGKPADAGSACIWCDNYLCRACYDTHPCQAEVGYDQPPRASREHSTAPPHEKAAESTAPVVQEGRMPQWDTDPAGCRREFVMSLEAQVMASQPAARPARESVAPPLEEVIGQWPGDETDEEVVAALKDPAPTPLPVGEAGVVDHGAVLRTQGRIHRCSLCGSSRIAPVSQNSGFGACSFIGCKDPMFDYRREHPDAPAPAPQVTPASTPLPGSAGGEKECLAIGEAWVCIKPEGHGGLHAYEQEGPGRRLVREARTLYEKYAPLAASTEGRAAQEEVLDALAWCVEIVDKAGLLNLSNGVQLGQTSWYVKAMDAFDHARALLEKRRGR